MRRIKRIKQFTRDFRRERSAVHGKKLVDLLEPVIAMLAADENLPVRYNDHMLEESGKTTGTVISALTSC